MKTFCFCLLVYVSILFYSCNNSVENEPIDMTDDRGTFLANTSSYMNGICWSLDGSEIYYFTDKLYAVNISTKTVRIIDSRPSNVLFDRNINISNDGSKIFYINNVGYGNSVYSIDVNGQNLREIINDVYPHSIALSPDNNYIAYSNYYIHAYKFSDSTNRTYYLCANPLSYSPEGSELMCKSIDTSSDKIYRMKVSDGTYQISFDFSNPYYNYGCARWESDAFKMLYWRRDDNTYYLWNSTTNMNTAIFSIGIPTCYSQNPALNIGSSKAAFWTRNLKLINTNEVTQFDLHLVNLNNLQSSTVSNFKMAGMYFYLSTTCIAFSPDGSKIAYGMNSKIYMRVLQ
jgi:hypothetical protein